jgi:hemin uptake protein HemP
MNAVGASDEDKNKSATQQGGGTPRAVAFSDGRLDSRELFIGTREIMIAHGGDLYRLRLTAQNKLILTK